ncbi:MAG: hypothetical protein II179_01720, partial [Alphaproteobacteria bacterium]|nr:hypothetical protein [Alphaproteobacteria bacterium]
MKVLTSRVIVSVMISVLMIAAAPAEDKVGGDLGDKTGGVDVPIKGGTRSVTDHQLFTSKAYVDQEIAELSSHKVNGQALSNENIYFYATETERSTAGMAIKTVLLSAGSLGSGITTIPTGMVL